MGLKEWVKEHEIVLALFLVSTAFFIIQHASALSWDFTVYVSNARYWMGQGGFYEHLRPPLASFMMLILSIFGSALMEYLYVIAVCLIFLVAVLKFSKATNLNKNIVYIVALSPFLLKIGVMIGTELLSLALIMIAVSLIISRSWYAGVFLGLAALSRYNFVVFILLLLFYIDDIKKGIVNTFFFCALFIPWFVYNYLEYKNIFMSIADNYAQNVLLRGYITTPFEIAHLWAVVFFLTPLLVLGFTLALLKIKTDFKTLKFVELIQKERMTLIIILFGVLCLIQYQSTPLKLARYLFPFIMVVIYFSALSLEWIKGKNPSIVFILLLLIVLGTIVTLVVSERVLEGEDREIVDSAVSGLKNNHLENCYIMSNAWPLLNYFGVTAEPASREDLLSKAIKDGEIGVIFVGSREPDWANNKTFLKSFPVIYEDNAVIIIGNSSRCMPQRPVDTLYVSRLKKDIEERYNYTINTNPCFILFMDYSFVEKTCNLFNGNGFKTDENRAFG